MFACNIFTRIETNTCAKIQSNNTKLKWWIANLFKEKEHLCDFISPSRFRFMSSEKYFFMDVHQSSFVHFAIEFAFKWCWRSVGTRHKKRTRLIERNWTASKSAKYITNLIVSKTGLNFRHRLLSNGNNKLLPSCQVPSFIRYGNHKTAVSVYRIRANYLSHELFAMLTQRSAKNHIFVISLVMKKDVQPYGL